MQDLSFSRAILPFLDKTQLHLKQILCKLNDFTLCLTFFCLCSGQLLKTDRKAENDQLFFFRMLENNNFSFFYSLYMQYLWMLSIWKNKKSFCARESGLLQLCIFLILNSIITIMKSMTED